MVCCALHTGGLAQMNIEILPAFTIPIGVVKLGPEFCEPLKKYKGIEQFDFYVLDKIPDLKRKLIKLFLDLT